MSYIIIGDLDMSPVEGLFAYSVIVTACSDGLINKASAVDTSIEVSEKIVDLRYVSMPPGSFIELVSNLQIDPLAQRIESETTGAKRSANGKSNTIPLEFVKPGTNVSLANVYWKST